VAARAWGSMSEVRSPPSLGALQELLYGLMTAPTGVNEGLVARGLPLDALDALIAGDVRLGPAARLDIYANMYFFRIRDILREEYPRLAAALGPEAFHDLITDYILIEPPAHPSLRAAGARLPAFLRAHARNVGRPWLSELAALERMHRELFDGPDAEPLTLETLQILTPEAFSTLEVRLVPAHRVLVHAFDLSRVWTALEAREGAPHAVGGALPHPDEPRADAETLLVWRRDVTVYHRPVSGAAEATLLRHAAEPTTLGALCEGFVDARGGAPGEKGPGDESALAAEAFQILARWVDDGLLAAG